MIYVGMKIVAGKKANFRHTLAVLEVVGGKVKFHNPAVGGSNRQTLTLSFVEEAIEDGWWKPLYCFNDYLKAIEG